MNSQLSNSKSEIFALDCGSATAGPLSLPFARCNRELPLSIDDYVGSHAALRRFSFKKLDKVPPKNHQMRQHQNRPNKVVHDCTIATLLPVVNILPFVQIRALRIKTNEFLSVNSVSPW